MPPVVPLPTLDNFDRAEREPALGRRRAGRTASSAAARDRSLHHLEHARLLEVDDLHRLAQHWPVRPRRRGRGRASATLPGTGNALRLYVRIQQPGSLGLRRIHAAHEPARGDRPGLPRADRQRRHRHPPDGQPGARGRRHPAPACEGHDASRPGATTARRWSRLGVVTDSTYAAAGFTSASACAGRPAGSTTSARGRWASLPPPPPAPQSLQATAGNAQVALAWSAPASNGGSAITGYSVYRGTAPNPDRRAHRPTSAWRRATSDSGRTNGQTYYYKVTALNAVGESAVLERGHGDAERTARHRPRVLLSRCRRPPATPRSPSSWSDALLGRRLGHHRLPRVPRNRSQPDRRAHPRSRPGHELPRQRAHERQIYYYKVTALNAIGESWPRTRRMRRPAAPATAPSAPQSLQATAGNAQVSLAWSAPSSDGGSAITGYSVYRGTASQPDRRAHPRSRPGHELPRHGRTNGRSTTTRSPP